MSACKSSEFSNEVLDPEIILRNANFKNSQTFPNRENIQLSVLIVIADRFADPIGAIIRYSQRCFHLYS